MSDFTLEQLLTPITRTEAVNTIYTLLTDAGYDLTLFDPGSPGANVIMAAAELLLSGNIQARTIASGTLAEKSSGDYLAALSEGHFGNTKRIATYTEGVFAFTGSNANLYKVVPAGGIAVSDGTRRFVTTQQVTIQSGSIVTASVKAESPGTAYNIPNNSSLTLQSDIDGASVTNGPIAGTSTWITTSAVDEESDSALRTRNRVKWATLGNTTAGWIEAHVLASGSATTKVKVIVRPDLGAGFVDIPVSADTSAVGSSEISTLQGIITSSVLFGNSGSVIVKEAPLFGLDLSGSVLFSKEYTQSEVQNNLETKVQALLVDVPMGGYDMLPSASNVFPIELLDRTISNINGVENWHRVLPSGDVYLPTSGVLGPGSGSYNNVTYTKLTNR